MTLQYISKHDLEEFQRQYPRASEFLRAASLCGEYIFLRRSSRYSSLSEQSAARLQELQALVDQGAIKPKLRTRVVELNFEDRKKIHYKILDIDGHSQYSMDREAFAKCLDIRKAVIRWANIVLLDIRSEDERIVWTKVNAHTLRSEPIEMLR